MAKHGLQHVIIKMANHILGRYNYTPEEWIEWLVKVAVCKEVKAEKEITETLIDFYNGKQLDYMDKTLEESYKLSWKMLALQKEILNIVRMFIDQTSVIYKFGARRDLVDISDKDREIPDNEKELWEWIQRTSKYNRKMKDVNKKVNLVENAVVRVWFDEDDGEIRLDIITRDMLDVIPHEKDPTKAFAVYYAQDNISYDVGTEINDTIYHYWTAEDYVMFYGNSTQLISIPNNELNINPFGMIPMVNFTQRFPENNYFVLPPEDLEILQRNINLKIIEQNHMLKHQAFATPVLIGSVDKGVQIALDPAMPITLEPGVTGENSPSFEYKTPNANFDALKNEIEDKIRRFAQSRGLPANEFSLSGNKSSAESLTIQSRALIDGWINTKEFYEDNEVDLFKIIKAVWNYASRFVSKDHKFYNVKFSDNTELSVMINEPQVAKDTTEQIDKHQFMLDNGLESSIEYYMSEDNLTKKEAIVVYKEVQANIKEYPSNVSNMESTVSQDDLDTQNIDAKEDVDDENDMDEEQDMNEDK